MNLFPVGVIFYTIDIKMQYWWRVSPQLLGSCTSLVQNYLVPWKDNREALCVPNCRLTICIKCFMALWLPSHVCPPCVICCQCNIFDCTGYRYQILYCGNLFFQSLCKVFKSIYCVFGMQQGYPIKINNSFFPCYSMQVRNDTHVSVG